VTRIQPVGAPLESCASVWQPPNVGSAVDMSVLVSPQGSREMYSGSDE
jgi:hypothetical protein